MKRKEDRVQVSVRVGVTDDSDFECGKAAGLLAV